MPDTASITLVKRFTYRDAAEEWSNTYHFTGPTPADAAAWKTLALAFHAIEKTCYLPANVLVRAYGYEPGNEHSIAQVDFTVGLPLLPPGTLIKSGSDNTMAGDQASWIAAYIGQSSTNKKVFVRKYFHGGATADTDPDEIADSLKPNLIAAAAALVAGTGLDGHKWSGPQGEEATLPRTSRYVTTRTLKRRGKRPS